MMNRRSFLFRTTSTLVVLGLDPVGVIGSECAARTPDVITDETPEYVCDILVMFDSMGRISFNRGAGNEGTVLTLVGNVGSMVRWCAPFGSELVWGTGITWCDDCEIPPLVRMVGGSKSRPGEYWVNGEWLKVAADAMVLN